MAIETRILKDGKTKRYVARVWDPVLRRKLSKSFPRRKDAEAAETLMKRKMYLGETLAQPADILFSDLADEVLENCTASEETIREYRRINGVLNAHLGRKSVRSIGARDIERMVAALTKEYAANTVIKTVIRLRHILRRAVAYGYITLSPAEHISNLPKAVNQRQMHILDEAEIRLLLEKIDPYWKPLFTVWLATGMRRSEIFGLDQSCIDIKNRRIHVRQQVKNGKIVPYTKNKRARTIAVSDKVIDVITKHMETAPYLEGQPRVVFPSKTGRPVHVSDFNRDVFRPLAEKIGKPKLVTHDLRHTFASHALSQGMNIKVLQDVLGHADASLTLNRYAHLIPSDGRAAADRMGDFLVREESVTIYGHSRKGTSRQSRVA